MPSPRHVDGGHATRVATADALRALADIWHDLRAGRMLHAAPRERQEADPVER